MLDILRGILKESFWLFYEMSPWLIIGFFFAGVLHVSFKLETIAKHLGKNRISSVIKAVVFGIPLPLCSCGVIPAGVLLRKSGASKGSTISFLIATPITGADSIMATYSLMGGVFTVFRVVASSLTAIVAGVIANFAFDKEDKAYAQVTAKDDCPCLELPVKNQISRPKGKIYRLFHYAFVKSIGDIWRWLLLGILLGGVISYLVPITFIQKYLGNTWISMLAMLVIGLPTYICSTGSIPIAASLVLKGMNPGAALVFLLAGPATSAVTMTIVSRELGKKAFFIYLGSIAFMSVLLGYLFNVFAQIFGFADFTKHMHSGVLPVWMHQVSTFLLALFIIAAFLRGGIRRKQNTDL